MESLDLGDLPDLVDLFDFVDAFVLIVVAVILDLVEGEGEATKFSGIVKFLSLLGFRFDDLGDPSKLFLLLGFRCFFDPSDSPES